jgi:hypothetical protein
MSTQITCKYSCYPTGPNKTATNLSTLMAAVPIENETLLRWGLRVISDNTGIVASLVSRTIVLGMLPTVTATVQANLDGSMTPSRILTCTVETTGSWYVRPPTIQFADTAPGIGSGAAAYATLGVFATTLGGAEATPYVAPIITASGGQLAPGGKQATFTANVVGGSINTVTINTNGGPYNVPPTLTITDAGGGAGQTVTAQLGLSGIVMTALGQSYTNPVVTVTPYFKSGIAPDAAGVLSQAQIVQSWMKGVLQAAMNVSIIPALNVVA